MKPCIEQGDEKLLKVGDDIRRNRRWLLGALAALAAGSHSRSGSAQSRSRAAAAPARRSVPLLPGDLTWSPSEEIFDARVLRRIPERAAGAPLYNNPAQHQALLVTLQRQGRAAGNIGDLYDNRDRRHAVFKSQWAPDVTLVEYASDLKSRNIDYGLNDFVRFDAPVFGNASIVFTGFTGRSLVRHAMTSPGRMERVARLYRANHLYVYPAHRDYDDQRGDRFPALAPQMIASVGSSPSVHAHLQAIAAILAGLRPNVKAFLRGRGLLAPVVQTVYRRSFRHVADDAAYLTAEAHPSAFSGDAIDLVRAVRAANAITRDALPPQAALKVVGEDGYAPGVDHLDGFLGEALFDTPDAVARIFRGLRRWRRYRLSAEESHDPNGRPLAFHWIILRGDPDLVRIAPVTRSGSVAEISVAWNDLPSGSGLPVRRVDIALFTHNGVHFSAPAFFCVLFPPNEKRRYREDSIISVDYDAGGGRETYVDPLLFPRRRWADAFDYDAEGRLVGVSRRREGGVTSFRIDAATGAWTPRPVYEPQRLPSGRVELKPKP